MGILLVYDVTDERSFNNIRNWIRNTEQFASEGVNKILVGNKCDMTFGSTARDVNDVSSVGRRAVSRERAQALADEYGLKFIETSAKNGLGVEEAFMTLTKDVKKRLIDNAIASSSNTATGGSYGTKEGTSSTITLEETSFGKWYSTSSSSSCCWGGNVSQNDASNVKNSNVPEDKHPQC